MLVPFCTPVESVLSPLLRFSLCGRNKPGSVCESLFTVVKDLWVLSSFDTARSFVMQNSAGNLHCDFLGQLYEVLVTLYIVKGQSAKSMQQVL